MSIFKCEWMIAYYLSALCVPSAPYFLYLKALNEDHDYKTY